MVDPSREAGTDTIASGTAGAFGAQLLGYALGLLGSVLIARALGPEGRGLYQLPVTAALLAVVLASINQESANTLYFAQRRFSLPELSANVTLLCLPCGAVAAIGLLAFYAATSGSVFDGVPLTDVLIVAATLPFQLHLLWMTNLFLLARRVTRSQFATLAGAVVQTTLLVALTAVGMLNVRLVLLLYATNVIVPWLLLVWWARRFAPPRPALDVVRLRATVAMGLKLHLGLVATNLLLRADIFLVSLYLGVREMGIYALAVLLAELLVLLTNPLVIAALPYQSGTGIQEAGRLSFRIARFNLVFVVALGALSAASLWLVIPAFYGAGFADAYGAMMALLPGVVALAISRPLGNWLVRQERPWRLTAIGVGALVINLALNVALLPTLGLVGAGLASSIAYSAVTFAFVLWGLRVTGLRLREVLVPTTEDARTIMRLVRRVVGRLREIGR